MLNSTELSGALLFHTLPMPVYSPYLQGGMVLQSLGGGNVTVAKVDGEIYFNDAKVISPNVLTNNGLIHVLDRVMSPNGKAPDAAGTGTSTAGGPTSTGGTGTGTGAGSSTGTSSPNAGHHVGVGEGNAIGGLLAFLGAAAVLF